VSARVLLFADVHLDATTQDNVLPALASILQTARDENPDIIVNAGDLAFKRESLAPWVSRELRRFHVALAEVAPVIVVPGNHDLTYREGERDMIKVKHRRTADAVVGGYRLHKDGDKIGSLLLGMYDEKGALHFVGHCSGFADRERARLLDMLRQLETDSSFGDEARRPDAPSRWSGQREAAFVAVDPSIVVEVSYDQITGGRFRHATRFERWRPDKLPSECTLDQMERSTGIGFVGVVGGNQTR